MTAKGKPCTCPHDVRPLGTLYGVNMGRGRVRLSTTAGCPEHDSCHRWTKAKRAAYAAKHVWASPASPYCPIHATKECPT